MSDKMNAKLFLVISIFLFTTNSAQKNYKIDMSNSQHIKNVFAQSERQIIKPGKNILINHTADASKVAALTSDPFGNVDQTGLGSISGWAYDPDAESTPIYVDIYINDSYAGRTLADWYRPDIPLADSRVKGDYHGFEMILPSLSPGTYSIKAYAVNYPSGNNPQLSITKYITVNKGTVYLNNGIVKAGVCLDWGGAISEIIYNNINLVDKHDTGRLVQASFYDGSYGLDPSNPNWGWNPVQGGDKYNFGSPVLDYYVTDTLIYTKTQPLEWNPDNKGGGILSTVLSSMYIEQWVSLSNNIVKLKYRINYWGTENHTKIGSQEFPCLYLAPSLHRIITYNRSRPWEKDTTVEKSAPEFPSFINFFTTEFWSSYVDDNNFGMAIFSNSLSPYFTATRITGSRVNYLNYSCSFDIPSNSIIENEIYLLIGNISSIRNQIYHLHLSHEPKINWEFNEDGNREGWSSWNDLSSLVVSDGKLKGSTVGEDPYMVNWSGLDIDADKYDKIEISMKANNASEVSFYFTTASDKNWGENKVKRFPFSASNDFKTYSITMDGLPTWSGKISQIRFDPAIAQSLNFEIDYIRIIPKSPTGTTTPEKIRIPKEFVLYQNYPNPFNPSTTIKFSIPNLPAGRHGPQFVTLKVYDLLGREVTTLVNEERQPGTYEVKFNGSDHASGVYFYRLQTGSYSDTKKFILMK